MAHFNGAGDLYDDSMEQCLSQHSREAPVRTVHLYRTELDSSRPQRSKDALRRTRSTVQYKIGTQYWAGDWRTSQMTARLVLVDRRSVHDSLPSHGPLSGNSVAVPRIFGPPTEWPTAQI